ncbi:hypothetical protein GCM10023350_23210 [Nocardioides endophyticus]|uniref:Uncharacterized protein n=1 Tax=Nocardioides endophyticus TaxID=1353775 RepID=A0ABP8YUX6_9ACTN
MSLAATVIFSMTNAEHLGGVSREDGSRPWGTAPARARRDCTSGCYFHTTISNPRVVSQSVA